MNIKSLAIITGVMLVLAIPVGWWPYDYYIVLRWVVSVSAIIIANGFNKSGLKGWMLVFGAVAFLFNPIVPIYLNKETWVLIDFVSAILFFVSAYSIKRK